MKRFALLATAFAFLAFSASAEQACKSRADLSWLVAPAPETDFAAATSTLDLASVQRTGSGAHLRCMVTASCGSYNISCSVPGTGCSGHDRACPDFPGHVTCNGVTTWCDPPTCPECTDGQIQFVPTGGCCFNNRTEHDKYLCVGGLWEYLNTVCKPPFCGPF